jgi:hypothetical protein
MVSSIGTSLINYYQGQTALALFGASNSSPGSAADALLSYYAQTEGVSGFASSGPAVQPAPTAPWNQSSPDVASTVRNAISGQPIVDPSSARLDAPAGVASADYKNLFAVYQGLSSLYDLASTAAQAGTPNADPTLAYLKPAQLQSAFASGMSQLENFLSNSPFTQFNLTAGNVSTEQTSTVGIPNGKYQTYTTGVIATGDESQALSVFQGTVQFSITVASKYAATTIKNPDGTTSTVTAPPTVVPIDLSGMGSTSRTIDNVVNYINAQLKAAKVTTQFAAANLGSTASTTTLPNGVTVTNKGATQWGLTINGSSGEVVSFSAPSTAAAVYVSSATGGAKTWQGTSQTATATGEQLMKLQTPNDVSGTAPPTITSAGSTSSNLPLGGVFAKNLPDGVSGVAASATAADGSVYLLANATGSVNNAPVQGAQGVVLLKYDSAGKLLQSKMVAGLQSASGASIAVGADGSVAVAGTNTTTATTNSAGITTPASTSAFVQVYDATGAALWSQSAPALAGTSTASGVAIGSDGSVYLSGTTTGSVGNQIPKGDKDEFIQGFDSKGKATFTQQFGSQGTNTSAGLVYDAASNSLYTAGLEDSSAVVRTFSLSTSTTGTGASQTTTTTATAGATRNLGIASSLVGIGLSGSQIVVGGNALAATIKAGAVTSPYVGVEDGFIASIDSSLTPSSGDTVAYLGQSGVTQVATAMTVAGGQAYLTGTMANDPSSLAAANATEGFVKSVDTSTGAVTYSSKFAGANGQDAPSSITVATAGSSILDQLGLPQGTVNATTSNLITSATSIKAGQSFWVRTSPGGPQTRITIGASDTLKSLADRINAAIGGQGKATVLDLGANSTLSISPNDAGSFIELDAQQESDLNPGASASSLQTNVLAALGLKPGVIRQVREINGLTDVNQLREYGLNLPTNLDLSTATSAQHAANALQAAMSAVMSAYQDLANPPTMASEALAASQSAGGSVPTYLSNELANMQAGLARLTAGQSGSTA